MKKYFSIGFVFVLFLLGLLIMSKAMADVNGPRDAGIGTDTSNTGTVPWLNPGNITTSTGNTFATVAIASPNISHYIKGEGYGFSIPTNATINGIQVTIGRKSSTSSSIKDNIVSLIKRGTVIGDNKAIAGSWSSSMTNVNYGGLSDLWGSTWTPDDINNSNFGVVLSVASNSTTNHTASVDYMQIVVSFTPAMVDSIPPIITLVGGDMSLCKGSIFIEPGASATDNIDSSVAVTITGTVDTSTPGIYTLHYNAIDAAGNHAIEVKRVVTVVDLSVPTISLLGNGVVTVEVGSTYVDAGATAMDGVDGNITSQITTVNSVNTSIVGTYLVSYNVSNSSAVPAIELIRTVNVVDTTPPVITLLGSNSINLEVGSTYTDAGANALDNYDGDITGNIITINPVDTTIVGTYIITYNVTDANHNSAEQKIRTIKVNDISPVPDIVPLISETHGGHRIISLPIQNNTQKITAGEVLGIEKFKFNTDLYFGMRSDEVKELQKRLISEGLLKPGTLGGYFGIFTKNAVVAYQKANIPLKIDGIVGPLTRQVLNNTQSGA